MAMEYGPHRDAYQTFLSFLFLSLSLSFMLWRPKLPICPTCASFAFLLLQFASAPYFSHRFLTCSCHCIIQIICLCLFPFIYCLLSLLLLLFYYYGWCCLLYYSDSFCQVGGLASNYAFSFHHLTLLNSKLPLLNKSMKHDLVTLNLYPHALYC